MSLKLNDLTIRWSTWPKPDHYDGSIEYVDGENKSSIKLQLTADQIAGLFPVVADVLVEVSQQAANILRAAIIQEQEKETEDEKEEIRSQG